MLRFIIDIKLLYLIIFINYFLILRLTKLKVNIYFAGIIFFFIIHGLIMYSLNGIPPNFLLSQIIGISIIGLYFYNFFLVFNLQEIIAAYLKLCLWVAILGYFMYFVGIDINGGGRLQSILSEPAHYVIIIIPVCYYFLKTKEYKKFLILFGTLILAGSSLGYIGCALMFIFINFNLKRFIYLLSSIPVIILVFWIVYQNNENVQMRFDDTYESLTVLETGKFNNKTNVSTYALLSNLYIAKCNFKDHPLGTGLGSHYYMYTSQYKANMRPPDYIVTLKLDQINVNDAASLFIRMFSELGVFGLLFIFYLLYLSTIVFNKNLILGQGIFIYLLLKLFRDGHYFPPELFFFIWLLYFSIRENQKLNNKFAAV